MTSRTDRASVGRPRAAAVDRTLVAIPLRLAVASAVLLALAILAFWPAYLSKLGAAGRATHVHAALGTGWLLLLVAQPLLVRRRALGRHRALGRLGVFGGAAFFASGIMTAQQGLTRMTAEQFERDGHAVYLPLAMAAIFALALMLGLVWRSVPSIHGRFMACTALPLLDPLFARILYFNFPRLPADFLYQVPAFALVAAVLAGLAVTIPAGVRGRAVFHAFSLGTVLVLLVHFVTPYSAAWMSFARWFRSLPLA